MTRRNFTDQTSFDGLARPIQRTTTRTDERTIALRIMVDDRSHRHGVASGQLDVGSRIARYSRSPAVMATTRWNILFAARRFRTTACEEWKCWHVERPDALVRRGSVHEPVHHRWHPLWSLRAHKPAWRRLLKPVLFVELPITLTQTVGRAWVYGVFGFLLAAAGTIHFSWLSRNGINGWTGEPREKYLALVGLSRARR